MEKTVYRRGLFSIVTILFWLSLYIYVPQLSNYAKELGASYKLIGLIAGAYGFSQTILRIPVGVYSDKLMKKRLFIILGIISTIFSAAVVYFLPTPITLLFARLFAGVAASTWVTFTTLFMSYYDFSETNKAIGIVVAASKVGQLVSMFIGGFLAIQFNINILFLTSMIFGFVCFLLGLFIYEPPVCNVGYPIYNTEDAAKHDKNITGIRSNLIHILKDRRIIHISLLGCAAQFITYSTNFSFTPIIATLLGANDLQLSFLVAIFTLPQILFSILSGTVLTRLFGENKTLILGFIITTIVCILTPLINNIYLLYCLQLVSGIGNAITFSLLMSMVMKDVNVNAMSTTMGFYQSVYGIGMIAGPIILGSVADSFGLTSGFFIVGLLGVSSIISLIKLEP